MNLSKADHFAEEDEVLVLAPTGQDANLIAVALGNKDMHCKVMHDADSMCRRINEEMAGALVIAEEALSPKSITAFNQSLSNQKTWSDIPIVLMTSKGEITHRSLKIIEAFAPAGNVTLIERPFRPLTLVNTLRVALRSRRRQYQVRDLLKAQIEATRLRDEFISIASHELKTPLTSLKIQLQFNQRLEAQQHPETFEPMRMKKLIDLTDRQIDRLSRLVEDMLDVSRINTGKLIIEKSRVDLSELTREVIERVSQQMVAAGCEVQADLENEVLGLWDRYRLEQVIINLLTNVIRYAPQKPVKIVVRKTGNIAKLVVQDQGIGISEADQKRIFNRFERAVSSGNISGLGIGLYICREIVERHAGSVNVSSIVGKGSEFTIQLPINLPAVTG